jgi:hypothetical protein
MKELASNPLALCLQIERVLEQLTLCITVVAMFTKHFYFIFILLPFILDSFFSFIPSSTAVTVVVADFVECE